MHCVDLDESFQTHIYLQNLASIQLRTSPLKSLSPLSPFPARRTSAIGGGIQAREAAQPRLRRRRRRRGGRVRGRRRVRVRILGGRVPGPGRNLLLLNLLKKGMLRKLSKLKRTHSKELVFFFCFFFLFVFFMSMLSKYNYQNVCKHNNLSKWTKYD